MDTIGMFENIIDVFSKASDLAQKKAEISRLSNEVFKMENECGSCYHWMKKSDCKRESHHKVSCGEMKCNDFKMCGISQGIINGKNDAIEKLKSTL